jgi:hypothetical protein
VAVAVEVVTGLVADLDSRELHQLRTSATGVELARVVTHDDVDP